MLFDKNQALKFTSLINVMKSNAQPYNVVIKIPQGNVKETRNKYEKLPQQTTQDIFLDNRREI